MPFYPALDDDVHPAAVARRGGVPVLPGGLSRSARARRYPSDMSDAEWAVCEPLLPAPAWLAGRGGRPAGWCMRDIVDAIRYLLTTGRCGGRCPPTSRLRAPSTGGPINGRQTGQPSGCTMTCATGSGPRPGATAAPTAAIIDSQSVKGSEMIGPRPPRLRRGQEDQRAQAAHRRRCPGPAAGRAGHRRVRPGPRRRQAAAVEPAPRLPLVRLAWADGGYAGKLVTWAASKLS